MKWTGKDQDDSQAQNILHLFIGSLKFSPNPNECHFMGWLQVYLKKEEKWVCVKREELVKGYCMSELDCTVNHLQYLFPKHKDYLSEK